MITCNLKGGLGNMMFQAAFLENAAFDNQLNTYYHSLHSHLDMLNDNTNHCPDLTYAHEYLSIFKNFNWKVDVSGTFSNKIAVPFHYSSVDIKDNTCYDGFFQCERYFPNREFILNLFEPSDSINQELSKYDDILKGTTCSIHVRRGDYVRLSSHHPVQSIEYFESAMNIIGSVDKYLIFSDDIEWCEETFTDGNYFFIKDNKDYIDMFLQSKCTHNIISNSSFSWWGAWMNKNENKKVVGPSKWFGPSKTISSKNIIPESWTII
jgi:hypothetical protein